MRRLPRGVLAFAAAALVGGAPTPAAGQDGVCVAVAGGDHAAVASAARRSLGAPSDRVDVRDAGQRAALASRCARLAIAVGPEALRAVEEAAPGAPVVPVMVEGVGGRAAVSPHADPRRVLETLAAVAPRARRIGVVYDPGRTGELIDAAQAAARDLGMELVALPARTVGEAIRAYQRFERELRADALWLVPDGTTTVQETVYYALELAHWRQMAVIGLSRWYVASGALFALQPVPESCGAAAGELGAQVLRGAVPARAVYARDHALYVNTRSAERLDLTLPRRILDAAAQVLP